jgi:hypothetical protein
MDVGINAGRVVIGPNLRVLELTPAQASLLAGRIVAAVSQVLAQPMEAAAAAAAGVAVVLRNKDGSLYRPTQRPMPAGTGG